MFWEMHKILMLLLSNTKLFQLGQNLRTIRYNLEYYRITIGVCFFQSKRQAKTLGRDVILRAVKTMTREITVTVRESFV